MSQSQSEFSFTIPESIYYLHIPILLRRFTFRLLLLILCIWFVQYDDEASIILTTEEGFVRPGVILSKLTSLI